MSVAAYLLTRGPKPVTQEWVHGLTFMQQTVLLTAIRGPDGLPKYHPVKYLLRWYRRSTLISSLDGYVLARPYLDGGGSFMGKSFELSDRDWINELDDLAGKYIQSLDEVPHHFQLHFMHAAEIVGYKHPEELVAIWWRSFYFRLVNDMHLNPETSEQLDRRLGDDRDAWLDSADPATVD